MAVFCSASKAEAMRSRFLLASRSLSYKSLFYSLVSFVGLGADAGLLARLFSDLCEPIQRVEDTEHPCVQLERMGSRLSPAPQVFVANYFASLRSSSATFPCPALQSSSNSRPDILPDLASSSPAVRERFSVFARLICRLSNPRR